MMRGGRPVFLSSGYSCYGLIISVIVITFLRIATISRSREDMSKDSLVALSN